MHIVKDGAFHGYLSALVAKEAYPAPIARPLTWLPHAVNPSGSSQVWAIDSKLGPLEGGLIHLGFNRPEMFHVLIHDRAGFPQASVVTIARDFDIPALHGAIHPLDGFLYVSGFQITAWGTTAQQAAGIARLRFTGAASPLPLEVAAMDQGILLRFETPLDPESALDLPHYSIERWDYRRTPKYGSAHYKPDGSLGQEWLRPSSAYLSEDKRAVFIGIPGMAPVMQVRLGWTLRSADGSPLEEQAHFTPHALVAFEPTSEGFPPLEVDLEPNATDLPATGPAPTEAEGERLYRLMGCMACHDSGETDQPKVGPSWKGLYGSQRQLVRPKATVKVDEAYLRESIIDPAAKLVKGYEKREAGMPIYAGVLTDTQIDSLILFIKSLK